MNMTQTSQPLMACLAVIFLSLLLAFAHAHPQCVDGKPPFEPRQPLSFCEEYSTLGCCSKQQDDEIKSGFEKLQSDITANDECLQHMKELLCLRCSPYAAHLYSFEETGMTSPVPGMCSSHCQEVYSTCGRENLALLSTNSLFRLSLRSSTEFCSFAKTADEDYCYPDLLTNPVLNELFTSESENDTTGCMCLQKVTENLGLVTILETQAAFPHLMYVGEQKGVIHVIDLKTSNRKREFLDLEDLVLLGARRGDERGLLSLAFHPDFKNNKRFILYYSMMNAGQHIVRVSQWLARNEFEIIPNSEMVIMEIRQPYSNHNGGQVLFGGDDGYLYIFTGDGGAGGDPQYNAQNLASRLGKVLRVDISERRAGFRVPPDNPFVNRTDALPEIWAYGLRNPWRCSSDVGDPFTGQGAGRIFCADVGQNAYEEIDIIEKGGNYGWASREGFECYNFRGRNTCGTVGPEVLPIHAYPHRLGKSVTGGYVYRGCDYPEYNGRYFYGDYVSGRLWTLKEERGRWRSEDIKMCSSETCIGNWVSTYAKGITTFGQIPTGGDILFTSTAQNAFSNSAIIYKMIFQPKQRSDPSACPNYRPRNHVALPQGRNFMQSSHRYSLSARLLRRLIMPIVPSTTTPEMQIETNVTVAN